MPEDHVLTSTPSARPETTVPDYKEASRRTLRLEAALVFARQAQRVRGTVIGNTSPNHNRSC